MNIGYYYDDEGRMCYSQRVNGEDVTTVYPLEFNRKDWRKHVYRHATTGEIKTAGEWAEEHLGNRGKGINCSTDWVFGLELYKDSEERLRQVFNQGE